MVSGPTCPPSGSCLVLLGGPGSGKGTHGKAIAEALGWIHCSTGVHFRRHMENNTPLGRLAREYIGRGELVPDQATLGLVGEILKPLAPDQGFILDGYPRSRPQAVDLDGLLRQRGNRLIAALFLHVSDGEILRRLSGRLTCQDCQKIYHRESHPPPRPGFCSCGGKLYQREDDHPENIRRRLREFHRLNGPLLDYYRSQNLLREMRAEGPIEEVAQRAVATAKQAL
jgi:adenylate kinase